tara:strand:+ start:326 stop:463 length:138 start_codon:yes stop_codon:yes gene_type:complete
MHTEWPYRSLWVEIDGDVDEQSGPMANRVSMSCTYRVYAAMSMAL